MVSLPAAPAASQFLKDVTLMTLFAPNHSPLREVRPSQLTAIIKEMIKGFAQSVSLLIVAGVGTWSSDPSHFSFLFGTFLSKITHK